MKKFWLMVVSTVSLLCFNGAQAREFFGIRLGFPELGVQLGSTTVFGRSIGGRLTADFGYGNSSVVLGGDILYYLTIPTPGASFDLDVYLGGGVGVGIGTNGGAIGYNAHAVLGLELLFTRSISGFLEVRPFGFGNLGYYYGGAIGVNFRL